MKKETFDKIPVGSIAKIQGLRGTLVKAYVYTEDGKGMYWFDGKKTIYTLDSIPEDAKITNKNLYIPILSDREDLSVDDWLEISDKNWMRLKELDKAAREKKQLVGRYISFPYADGFAVYQITEALKSKVRVMHCKGLGDDWMIPEIQDGEYIDRKIAEKNIARRDEFTTK